MSAETGVSKKLIDTGGLESQQARGTYDSRLKCMQDTYEASALATGSTIKMGGTLPAGARIQEVILATDAIGQHVHVCVGDSASAARYITYAIGTAALFTRLNAVDGCDYIIGTATMDNQIVITTSNVSTATGTIKLAVFYTE